MTDTVGALPYRLRACSRSCATCCWRGGTRRFGALGRAIDDAWTGVVSAGGATAGFGGVKVAALVTAATVAVTAPTVVPDLIHHPAPQTANITQTHSPPSPAPIQRSRPTSPNRTATVSRAPAATTPHASLPAVRPQRPPIARSTAGSSSGHGSAVAEFTPGPQRPPHPARSSPRFVRTRLGHLRVSGQSLGSRV